MTDWLDVTSRIQDATERVMGLNSVYTQISTGAKFALRAIFSGEAIIVSAGSAGSEIETHAPTADIKLADLPVKPKQLDEFTIGGIVYRIIAIEPDGQGMTSLGLEVKG